MSIEAGTLYVVATPIGNLGDMTPRAVEVLQQVDRIAAEDTRHSAGLMRHFGITTPMLSLHEHNERQKVEALLQRLGDGEKHCPHLGCGNTLNQRPWLCAGA